MDANEAIFNILFRRHRGCCRRKMNSHILSRNRIFRSMTEIKKKISHYFSKWNERDIRSHRIDRIVYFYLSVSLNFFFAPFSLRFYFHWTDNNMIANIVSKTEIEEIALVFGLRNHFILPFAMQRKKINDKMRNSFTRLRKSGKEFRKLANKTIEGKRTLCLSAANFASISNSLHRLVRLPPSPLKIQK